MECNPPERMTPPPPNRMQQPSRMVERRVEIGGIVTSYAEGPANGAPLVLLHGQGSQWEDYTKVLPTLTQRHHVYAIDVHGHGQSARLGPGGYTNRHIGELIAGFIDAVVGEPVILSGHSSGALLALWIAAHRPDMVSGLFLEDPPLYSSIPPRAERAIGGILPRLAAEFLRDDPTGGFQRLYVEKSGYFSFFGPLAAPLVRYSLRWIDHHPGEPLRIFFLPSLINVYFEGLANYDPAFGAAWDDGTWYGGFDTDAALAAVKCPTTLLHTNWWFTRYGTYYDADGTLMAAMDGDDAARATKLLGDVEAVPLSSGHLVHFERPKEYLAAVGDLSQRVRSR